MKVLVAGAGPAGLYFAYFAKRAHPDWHIEVVEQNRPDSTFGFGVVFSERALDFLRGDDPQTYDLITPAMQVWSDLTVVHRGVPQSVGIQPEFRRAVQSADALEGYDLVVAADGANSTVRGTADFGTSVTPLTNKFAWYGTTKPFCTLTQTFVQTEHGSFNAHHYRHAPDMSTFVFECDAATWQRAGLASMGESETLAYCERVFAETLEGHRLVSNNSIWRNFPNVRNRRWSVGNRHMRLAPRDFAWSYIQRSGRIDPERLRKTSPKFVEGRA